MKLRQKRVKLECDNCATETEWAAIEPDNPITLDIAKGWIVGYDITGGGAMSTGSEDRDYCSMKCLHEAIDKYFNPSLITDEGAKETKEVCSHCYGTGRDHGDVSMTTTCPSCNGDRFVIIKGGDVNP